MGHGQAGSVGGVGGVGGCGRNLSPHTPHTPPSFHLPFPRCPMPVAHWRSQLPTPPFFAARI